MLFVGRYPHSLSLSLSHTHTQRGWISMQNYIYIHTFTEKAKTLGGSMQNHAGYTKGTQRLAQKCACWRA